MPSSKLIIRILPILLLLTFSSFSQSVIRYECSGAAKIKLSEDGSTEGGSIEDFIKSEATIIYDRTKATISITFAETDKLKFFYRNVKFHSKNLYDNEEYYSYTADSKSGNPFFITFGDEFIKIDNRKEFIGYGFFLKKE